MSSSVNSESRGDKLQGLASQKCDRGSLPASAKNDFLQTTSGIVLYDDAQNGGFKATCHDPLTFSISMLSGFTPWPPVNTASEPDERLTTEG